MPITKADLGCQASGTKQVYISVTRQVFIIADYDGLSVDGLDIKDFFFLI